MSKIDKHPNRLTRLLSALEQDPPLKAFLQQGLQAMGCFDREGQLI
jgi:hypothetical protein